MKTLLAFATIALAALAFADGPKEGPRGPRPGSHGGPKGDPIVQMATNPKMAEKIGLSGEQRKQIKEINKANRNGAEELNKQLRETMKKQADLLKAEKVDEAAVMAEIDKAFEIRKEIAKRQTKRVIAIKAVLTPEQVAKALEEFKNRKKPEKPRAEGKDKDDGPCAEGDKPGADCDGACRECGEKCGKEADGGDKPRKHKRSRKSAED